LHGVVGNQRLYSFAVRYPVTERPLAAVALFKAAILIVKSFGRRLAYESPRGTNPRCVLGLWGFEELCVVRVTGVVFTRLPGTAALAVLPADQVTAAMSRVGKVGDNVWDRRD
jgi:hypothetical protein